MDTALLLLDQAYRMQCIFQLKPIWLLAQCFFAFFLLVQCFVCIFLLAKCFLLFFACLMLFCFFFCLLNVGRGKENLISPILHFLRRRIKEVPDSLSAACVGFKFRGDFYWILRMSTSSPIPILNATARLISNYPRLATVQSF